MSETEPRRPDFHFVIATTPTFVNTAEAHASAPVSEPHVDYLDGWRGVAIVLVLQSHFLPIAGIDTGQLGVDIFFCLSGLLMSNLLFVKRVPLGTFYKRRISRILPAFVLFVALMYGIAASRGNPRSWMEIVCTFAFLRSYLPAQPDIWSSGLPIGHLWSLNVEEHCYVFLSLLTLFAVLRSREVWVLGAASIAAMAMYYIYETSPRFTHTSFEIRTEVAASFLLLSAGYFLVRDRFARWVAPWMPLVAVPIAAFGYLPHSHWWMSAIVAPVLLAFSVNHLAQTPALVRGMLASWPWRKMGIWSYSIYLWQQPFYVIKSHLPAGIALLAALLAGLASFYLIEKPSRAWINARW